MFTSIDKALAAVLMALLYLVKSFFGVDFGWSAETEAQIVMALTALLVWIIPNKKTPPGSLT